MQIPELQVLLRTLDRNTGTSESSLINAMNGFAKFEDSRTRKLFNILVPRYTLPRHCHTQLLHLKNFLFFWNLRGEFLSQYHGLIDTIKIPLVTEYQISIPNPRSSNDGHPLTSLVQQRESEREKTIMHTEGTMEYSEPREEQYNGETDP